MFWGMRAFLGPLLLDIALDCLQCYITDASDIICPTPEIRFPVEFGNADGKLVTHSFGAGGFQVVDQCGDIKGRVDLHQEVDMIVLAPEFEQLATPAGKYPGEGFFQILAHIGCQHLTAVFSDEYHMQPKRIYNMRE